MPPEPADTDRGIADRITAADHESGHDLIAIDAWLPGTRPTAYAVDLTDGPSYCERYWRCRACGAERSRPDDFDAVCSGVRPEPVVTDGGSRSEVGRSDPEPATDLRVDFLTFGPGYRVHGPNGDTFVVDIEARTCRCSEHREADGDCVHLRRVAEAIREGELPGPDGRYVD